MTAATDSASQKWRILPFIMCDRYTGLKGQRFKLKVRLSPYLNDAMK